MSTNLIQSAQDIVTKKQATCDGFLHQAKVKGKKAKPYSHEAHVFWTALNESKAIDELMERSELREGLVAMAGISEKAKRYITGADIDIIIKALFASIRDEFPDTFKEQIFYRYMFTRGASIDGEMKNYVGANALQTLTLSLLREFENRGIEADTLFAGEDYPISLMESIEKIVSAQELLETVKPQQIVWPKRVLLFDKRPKLIKKSVDLILLETAPHMRDFSNAMEEPKRYLALGELKGGIDPAGADEHWKTAGSALRRLADPFKNNAPPVNVFFVGAAIQNAMAQELFNDLQSGVLAKVANLTVEPQVQDLISWLLSL